MKKKIEIIAMKSWGELGNLLAAKTLATHLNKLFSNVDVIVTEAETLFPVFQEIGEKIRIALTIDESPVKRCQRYFHVMQNLEKIFFEDFEISHQFSPELSAYINSFDFHLKKSKPDIVVGTKGVLSRIFYATILKNDYKIPVINFITNQGLLDLPIHRSKCLPNNFVQYDYSKESIIKEYNYNDKNIKVVGRLISKAQVAKLLETKACQPKDEQLVFPSEFKIDDRPKILLFSNRSLDSNIYILNYLSKNHPNIPLVFVGYNQPELVSVAQNIKEREGHKNWRIFTRLKQSEFFYYLKLLSDSKYPILISKTGPNTMAEGIYFGMPQLLLQSGLPMEKWVGPFVQQYGFGHVFNNVNALTLKLDQWIGNPFLIAKARKIALTVSQSIMNQTKTKSLLKSAFSELIFSKKIFLSNINIERQTQWQEKSITM